MYRELLYEFEKNASELSNEDLEIWANEVLYALEKEAGLGNVVGKLMQSGKSTTKAINSASTTLGAKALTATTDAATKVAKGLQTGGTKLQNTSATINTEIKGIAGNKLSPLGKATVNTVTGTAGLVGKGMNAAGKAIGNNLTTPAGVMNAADSLKNKIIDLYPG